MKTNFFSPLSYVAVFGSGIRDNHPGSATLNYSYLLFRRGESDPDPGQPDRPAIGRDGATDQPPQQGGAEGRVADPDPDSIGSVESS